MVTVYGPEDLARAQRIANEHEGGRYIWGGCSREGSDCSGFMSIILNAIQGRPLYVRRFGTGTISQVWEQLGLRQGISSGSDFSLGVIYPWESSSGIGHVAGTLGSLNVESRGGRGVLVGPDARGAANPLFRHHFHLSISEEDALTADQMKELKTHINAMAEQTARRTIHAIMTGGIGLWANPDRSGWEFYKDEVRAACLLDLAGTLPDADDLPAMPQFSGTFTITGSGTVESPE